VVHDPRSGQQPEAAQAYLISVKSWEVRPQYTKEVRSGRIPATSPGQADGPYKLRGPDVAAHPRPLRFVWRHYRQGAMS
jgi:hypothetical protein